MPKTNGQPVESSGSSSGAVGEHPHQQKVPGSGGKGQAGGGASKDVEWSELLLVMPKEEGGHYWKALFEGGEEKSYWEVGGTVGGWAVDSGMLLEPKQAMPHVAGHLHV
jgi:hypothetical protein